MNATTPETDAPPRGGPARRRVLLLETDLMIRALILEWLVLAGHEALPATDLAEARALGEPCDLILADLPAPQRAARQMVNQLLWTLPGAPIIAMSADMAVSGRAAREALARELGVSAVLVKPFTQRALLCAIERIRV